MLGRKKGHGNLVESWAEEFLCFLKKLIYQFEREEGWGETDRQTWICCSTYLCIHRLLLVCALTWDLRQKQSQVTSCSQPLSSGPSEPQSPSACGRQQRSPAESHQGQSLPPECQMLAEPHPNPPGTGGQLPLAGGTTERCVPQPHPQAPRGHLPISTLNGVPPPK